MSLFESIEFFFAKDNKTIIPFDLNTKEAPRKPVMQQHNAPRQREQQPSFLPKKKKAKVPVTTIKKEATAQPKKDHFYTEWEKKYRELHAENLLAKKPFKKHALFIIDEKAPRAFAEKIAAAINTRLMKTTFIISSSSIEALIQEHNPSHIISTKEITSTLPTIITGDLNAVEKDPEKKKILWNTLQKKLLV
ncbi:MAG: hypothetical protein SP4CHLAM5_03580 [Chlamydiia bacterium]|nr:hypothetical protein [Chlamydiia bacterium]MCH9618232.1 hypothetical protein [Chlamydiia bacterium]MCH9624463.1 hypothetical protein [Chlamydiia bacterium]